jgi:hypothetical protein
VVTAGDADGILCPQQELALAEIARDQGCATGAFLAATTARALLSCRNFDPMAVGGDHDPRLFDQ